jgi:hypothetical protein
MNDVLNVLTAVVMLGWLVWMVVVIVRAVVEAVRR